MRRRRRRAEQRAAALRQGRLRAWLPPTVPQSHSRARAEAPMAVPRVRRGLRGDWTRARRRCDGLRRRRGRLRRRDPEGARQLVVVGGDGLWRRLGLGGMLLLCSRGGGGGGPRRQQRHGRGRRPRRGLGSGCGAGLVHAPPLDVAAGARGAAPGDGACRAAVPRGAAARRTRLLRRAPRRWPGRRHVRLWLPGAR